MAAQSLSFASAVRRPFLRARVPLLMLITLLSALALVAQPRVVLSVGKGAQPIGSITQTERGIIRSTTALSFTAAFTTYLPPSSRRRPTSRIWSPRQSSPCLSRCKARKIVSVRGTGARCRRAYITNRWSMAAR